MRGEAAASSARAGGVYGTMSQGVFQKSGSRVRKSMIVPIARKESFIQPGVMTHNMDESFKFRAEGSQKRIMDVEAELEAFAGNQWVYEERKREMEDRFHRELVARKKKTVVTITPDQRRKFEAEITRVRARIEEIYSNQTFLLNPETPSMYLWRLILFIVFVWCAVWTPFEVAFLPTRYDGLFAVSRFLDCVLFAHFFINCITCYQDPVSGLWIRDRKKIFARYCKGRFLLDLTLSVGTFVADIMAANEYPSSNNYDVLRLLRLTLLFQIPGLFNQLVTRYYPQLLNLSYNQIALVRFSLLIAFTIHFMACSWRLVVKLEQNSDEFIDSWIMRDGLLHERASTLYIICGYWATTTVTTIGYGDIANPGTPLERALSVLVMLCGALVWAYIIGGVTAVVSSFNVEDLEFSEQMDQLNQYMDSKHMDLKLRNRLRKFFRHRRSLEQEENHMALLEKMSPTLRGEVARSVSKEWLQRVPWLKNGTQGFIASVAIALKTELYAPQEAIVGTQLRVLTKGVVAKDNRIYTRGSVWGVDIILSSLTLKNMQPGRALTFAYLLALDSDTLEELLELYPEERARIKASAVWLGLQRSFSKYAQQVKIATQIIRCIFEGCKTSDVDVEKLFAQYDSRNSGVLSRNDFFMAMRLIGYDGPTLYLEAILGRFCTSDTDYFEYRPFLEYMSYHADPAAIEWDLKVYGEYLDLSRLKRVRALQASESKDVSALYQSIVIRAGKGRRSSGATSALAELRMKIAEERPSSHLSKDKPSSSATDENDANSARKLPGRMGSSGQLTVRMGSSGRLGGGNSNDEQSNRKTEESMYVSMPIAWQSKEENNGISLRSHTPDSSSNSHQSDAFRSTPIDVQKRARKHSGAGKPSALMRLVDAQKQTENEPEAEKEYLAAAPISENVLDAKLEQFKQSLFKDFKILLDAANQNTVKQDET